MMLAGVPVTPIWVSVLARMVKDAGAVELAALRGRFVRDDLAPPAELGRGDPPTPDYLQHPEPFLRSAVRASTTFTDLLRTRSVDFGRLAACGADARVKQCLRVVVSE